MRITVISNSTPIIELTLLGKLELLNELFEKVYVTRQVYEEIVTGEKKNTGAMELKECIENGNIIMYNIVNNKFVDLMYGRLHKGELSVIVAAKELKTNYVLMDDASGRKMADEINLVPIGTVGILKLAKNKGYIPKIKPLIDKMIENNFRISLKLYNEILKDTNEV